MCPQIQTIYQLTLYRKSLPTLTVEDFINPVNGLKLYRKNNHELLNGFEQRTCTILEQSTCKVKDGIRRERIKGGVQLGGCTNNEVELRATWTEDRKFKRVVLIPNVNVFIPALSSRTTRWRHVAEKNHSSGPICKFFF